MGQFLGESVGHGSLPMTNCLLWIRQMVTLFRTFSEPPVYPKENKTVIWFLMYSGLM